MWLMIEAVDVLMFRDGRPFDSGEGHVAYSLFPPSAFTIQGALRALLISESGTSWADYAADTQATGQLAKAIGHPKQRTLGQLRLRGPYVARYDDTRAAITRYFPLPADVVARKNSKRLSVLNPTDYSMHADNSDLTLPASALSVALEDEEPAELYWLSEAAFVQKYLANKAFSVDDCVVQEDLFIRENRTGTAINYERNTVAHEDGKLYTAAFVRPQQNVGLLVEIVEPSPFSQLFPRVGMAHYLRLGGEGRTARVERVDSMVNAFPTTAVASQSAQKIVFITPTYFEGGWKPGNAQRAAFNAGFVTAALRRPLLFGGWDVVAKKPKAIRRYIPPGSVYFFKPGTTLPNPLVEQPGKELPLDALGFGEFVVASWSETAYDD